MPRYEYISKYVSFAFSVIDCLNEMGKDGWVMCAAVHHNDGGVTFYFKRQLDDGNQALDKCPLIGAFNKLPQVSAEDLAIPCINLETK